MGRTLAPAASATEISVARTTDARRYRTATKAFGWSWAPSDSPFSRHRAQSTRADSTASAGRLHKSLDHTPSAQFRCGFTAPVRSRAPFLGARTHARANG